MSNVRFEKVKQPSIKQIFIETILKKIFSGELEVGEKLPGEREMASQMGISRSIINQGLLDLERYGFIRMVPRRGNFVEDYLNYPTSQTMAVMMKYNAESITPEFFENLMDVRRLSERECVRLACSPKGSIEEIRKCEEILELMDENPEEMGELAFRFHYQIMKASGNPVYTMLFKSLETMASSILKEHYSYVENRERGLSLYQRLQVAILNKDLKRANRILDQLIKEGIESLHVGRFSRLTGPSSNP